MPLRRLINRLLEDEGQQPVKFNVTNADAPFRALENIQTFTKYAKLYGVPETSIFASVDLFEGQKGPFIDVINCLNELAMQVRGDISHSSPIQPKQSSYVLVRNNLPQIENGSNSFCCRQTTEGLSPDMKECRHQPETLNFGKSSTKCTLQL